MKLPKRRSAEKLKDAVRSVELPQSQFAWPIPLAALIAASWVWVIITFVAILLASGIWISTADSITQYSSAIYSSFALVLLSHSIPVTAGGLTFSIPPLVITFFVIWLIKKATQWAVRSTLVTNLAGALLLIVTMMISYSLLALVMSAFASDVANFNASKVLMHSSLWSLAGILWGILRSPGEVGPTEKRTYTNSGERTEASIKPQSPHTLLVNLWQSTPSTLQIGFAIAIRSFLIIFGVAFLFTAVVFAISIPEMLNVVSLIATDTNSTVVMILSFVIFIPNIIVWYMALLIGPGIVVGGGSAITLITQVVGALPALPIFSVIPHNLPWIARILILVPVTSTYLVAATFGRRQFQNRQVPISIAISVAIYSGLASSFIAFIFSAQASGAFGAGRFLDVGINLWQISLWAFAWGAIGASLGLIDTKIKLAPWR